MRALIAILSLVTLAACQPMVPNISITDGTANNPSEYDRGDNTPQPGEPAPADPVPTNPPPTTDPVPNPGAGNSITKTYSADNTDFPNPERGWYVERGISGTNDYQNRHSSVFSAGHRLHMLYISLGGKTGRLSGNGFDDYRDRALDQTALNLVEREFAALRSSGVKAVVRFAYNRDENIGDASLSRITQHIGQLAPLLNQYQDVISVLQAGFIGAWGEWHASTNGLTDNNTEGRNRRNTIIQALLNALPENLMIQLRYPAYRFEAFGTPSSSVVPFGGAQETRVGFYNDCFLTTADDTGTYTTPNSNRAPQNRAEAMVFSKYTAMGGETCSVAFGSTRQHCTTALKELAEYNWDYLNLEFFAGTINLWKEQGCYNEISRRLGYRFELTEVKTPTTFTKGAALDMSITVRNVGFGKLYNTRPLRLIMVPAGGGSPVVVTVASDARKILPLSGNTSTINITQALPAGTASGNYDLYLELPDNSAALRGDPRYSIRLANQDMWVSASGRNDLKIRVTVP